jgi:hypothetical protein
MNGLAGAVSPEVGEAYGRVVGLVALIGFGCVAFAVLCISLVKASRLRTRGWTITAVLSCIAMFGSLAGAVNLVAKSVAEAARDGGKAIGMPQEISSKDGRVSIKIPGSWGPLPELHPAAIIAVGDKARERYGMVLPTGRASYPGSLDDFDKFLTAGLREALKEAQVSEPETVEIGGYRAIRRTVSGDKGGKMLVYHQVLVETRSTYYQVLLWTGAGREAAAEVDFRNIVGSFAAEAGPAMPE